MTADDGNDVRRPKATVTGLTAALAAAGRGVHWSLEPPSQLNINLVRLEPGQEISEHRNSEVDVAVLVLAGRGALTVEGTDHALATLTIAHVPRGATRRLRADLDGPGLSYLTVHPRRGGPTIGPPRRTDRWPPASEAEH